MGMPTKKPLPKLQAAPPTEERQDWIFLVRTLHPDSANKILDTLHSKYTVLRNEPYTILVHPKEGTEDVVWFICQSHFEPIYGDEAAGLLSLH